MCVCVSVCLCVCVSVCVSVDNLNISGSTVAIDLNFCMQVAFGILVSIPALLQMRHSYAPWWEKIHFRFSPPLLLKACSSKYFSKTTYFWWACLNQWTCGYLFMYAMSPLPHPRGSFGGKFKTFRNCLFNLNISNNIYVNLNCLICTIFYKSRAFIWHIVYVCGVHGS